MAGPFWKGSIVTVGDIFGGGSLAARARAMRLGDPDIPSGQSKGVHPVYMTRAAALGIRLNPRI